MSLPAYIGIVQNPLDEKQISIGIIDFSNDKFASQAFYVEKMSFSEVVSMLGKDVYPLDLGKIDEFLKANISIPRDSQLLIELPSPLLDDDDIKLKILGFLSRKGYGIFGFGGDQKTKKVQISRIPKEMKPPGIGENEVIYLWSNLSQFYVNFLLGKSTSIENAALASAIIAKEQYLYYFLMSNGIVQSSQDIVTFMRHPPAGGSGVISGNEIYHLTICQNTRFDNLEKIPLEYALAAKKHEALGNHNALKFSLLTVCKKWNIRLSCVSFLDESLDKSTPIDPDFFLKNEKYVIYNPMHESAAFFAP